MSENQLPETEDFRSIALWLDAEVDRQAAEQARSLAALTNRAALLISSALIFVAIPKGGDGSEWFWAYVVSLIAALLGAVCGVVALFFRPKRSRTKVSTLEEQLAYKTEIEAIRALRKSKEDDLKKDRKHTTTLGKITAGGFVLLVVSLGFITLYLVSGELGNFSMEGVGHAEN